MVNNLFSMLKGRLKNADKERPSESCLVMGYDKKDLPKSPSPLLLMNKNFMNQMGTKAHLLWYDLESDTFYDQGIARKMKPADYRNTNAQNFKRNKPNKAISLYIPIDNQVVSEAANTKLKDK